MFGKIYSKEGLGPKYWKRTFKEHWITVFMLLSSISYYFPACNFTSHLCSRTYYSSFLYLLGCFLLLPLTGLGPAEGLCFCSSFQHLMPQQLSLSMALTGLLTLGRSTVNTWQLCKHSLEAAKKLSLSIFRNYFREVLNGQISINLNRSNKMQTLRLPEQPAWRTTE